MQNISIIILLLSLVGCTTVEWKVDEFNTPIPVVNGKTYYLTDQERLAIANAYIKTYCAVE